MAFQQSAPHTPLRLYSFRLSGHAHRVRLMCSLLGLPVEVTEVDMPAGAHKTPEFLRLNPLGQVPVFVDGDLVLSDSNAILVYLATVHDAERNWYPEGPVHAARIQRWLSLAAGELAFGPAVARAAKVFKRPTDERPLAIAARLFGFMEQQLESSPYLAGQLPTIADVAMYSYTAHAPEGGLSLDTYPRLVAWLRRVETLEGFIDFPWASRVTGND